MVACVENQLEPLRGRADKECLSLQFFVLCY